MIINRHSCALTLRQHRCFSRCNPRRSLSELALARPVQVYKSTSRDPYLNLSIEHHLLQKAATDSVVLFLYVNRPSIIIGRNQNPWLEVNLALLNAGMHTPNAEPTTLGPIDLVRRRSGGGTVFHDEGNVNWTVISSTSSFTRDKHAEMVVRALRGCGIDRARVNERHDVVLDQGVRAFDAHPEDTHRTPYQSGDSHGPPPLKVSGSAYKLTRQRALHHGTCLLSSSNLHAIPLYLHSPAKPFIKARGVESVSSPVGNILISCEHFTEAVTRQFLQMYSPGSLDQTSHVGPEALQVAAIQEGFEEIMSLEWTYLQTPQFSIDSHSAIDAVTTDQLTTADAPRVDMTVRYGAITEARVRLGGNGRGNATRIEQGLIGRRLHEIKAWDMEFLSACSDNEQGSRQQVSGWLQKVLPPSHLHVS